MKFAAFKKKKQKTIDHIFLYGSELNALFAFILGLIL